MEKLLKGNIYTDMLWLIIGVTGGIYFYTKCSYWTCGIFILLAVLYLLKVLSKSIKKMIDK